MVNTFDVDWHRVGGGLVESSSDSLVRVLRGLVKCSGLGSVEVRDSSSGNGFHVRVSCPGCDSDACRVVLDSPERYGLEVGDPVWTRNVLWNRKTYVKGGSKMVGCAGPWESV